MAQGVYTENLTLTATINLLGGYDAPDWITRTLAAHATAVNGYHSDAVLTIDGDYNPLIEGFTFYNGHRYDSAGGGVRLVNDAAPTLRFNWILSNVADLSGGGIYVGPTGTQPPTIISNTIVGNTSGSPDGGGGGIYVKSRPALIQGNVISGNHATDNDGGGLYLTGGTTAQVVDNKILSNTAHEDGGGVQIRDSHDVFLASNVIRYNTAITRGGGLSLSYSDATLNDNIVANNAAYEGGGLFLNYSDATLTNNIVADNRASSAAGSILYYTATGSGLYIRGSSPHLKHTTVARNGGGSGVYVTNSKTSASTVSMTNTILVSHVVGITVTAGNTTTLKATLWGTATWANETDWSGDGTIITTLNLWGDPAFIDPERGDYHISSDSTATDTGVDAEVTTDIDGDSRPLCSDYDIGADEWLPKIYLPLTLRQWPPIPEQPELYSIDNTDGNGSYQVCWSIADRADDYVLEEATNGVFIDETKVYTSTDTCYAINNKGPGIYYYRVRAHNIWGYSNWSNFKGGDVRWENEPDHSNSGPLIPGVNYYGYPNDEWDHFRIDVCTEERVTVDLTNHTGQGLQLQLRDENNGFLDYDYEPPYHIVYAGSPVPHYVSIYTKSGHNSDTPYILHATFPSKVALRTIHERYVTASGDDHQWKLEAETTELKAYEVFMLVWLDDNKVALRTFYGRYVTATDTSQGWILKGDATNVSACEKFTLVDLGNGTVAFKTCHGRYVSARDDGEEWLLKQAEWIKEWEWFVLVLLPFDYSGQSHQLKN